MTSICHLHSTLGCVPGHVDLLLYSAFLLLSSAAVSDEANATGNDVGFEALLRPLLGPAYGVALHFTRNRQDAEDLVQEAALAAFRGFGTFQPGSNFKAWFFRILMNCFYAAHRKRRPEASSMRGVEDVYELYL